MPSYAVAQPVRLATIITDPATGEPADATSISLILQRPDLTTQTYTTASTPAIVHGTTGNYSILLNDETQPGPYQYAWVTTGSAPGETPSAGFTLVARFTPAHIFYEDARARLNISAATDSEIQDMIASAVSEQEQRVGAVAPRPVTEQLYAHHGRLALSTRPVVAVVSATLAGSPVDVSTWRVPAAMAGLVELGTGPWWGSSGPAFSGQLYTVTYTAGRNPVPQDLVEAALLRVQHSYATQRGASAGGGQIIGAGSSDLSVGVDSSDFLLLLRAQDKEKPYVLPSVA